jgi:predicted transcriptional regulator
MNDGTVKVYAAIADKKERDPYGPDGGGRATVVNGRGFQRWQRFHGSGGIVWIELDGKMIGLTPWQAKVYDLSRTYIDKGGIKIRDMAGMLGCAPSTVSRALVRLMAWGLIGYIVARGRNGGAIIFRMVKGDGFERFRQAAKAKVRAWSKASYERLSRLQRNVAPYFLERKGKGTDTLYSYLETVTVKDATIKPWTVDDLREAGIL